jgi:hypothetical protein
MCGWYCCHTPWWMLLPHECRSQNTLVHHVDPLACSRGHAGEVLWCKNDRLMVSCGFCRVDPVFAGVCYALTLTKDYVNLMFMFMSMWSRNLNGLRSAIW